MYHIKIKRIYDPPETGDGYRILVDRLWPRGIGKEKATLDEWNKDVAPSPEARKDFNHDPTRMEDFKHRYIYELDNNQISVDFAHRIEEKLKSDNVTLLFAAKSTTINHAIILKEWLEENIDGKS